MHSFLRTLTLTAILTLSSCASIPENSHSSIRLVHAGPEIGSAIRLSPRYLVTNIHVIDEGFSHASDQHRRNIEVLQILRSTKMDLAILITECTNTQPPRTRTPRKNELVTFYGPQTMPRRETTLVGKVIRTELYASHPKPMPDVSLGMALDTYIPLGFSGGPIIGDDGSIVGMSQGNVTLDEELGPSGYFYSTPSIIAEANALIKSANLPVCS